MALDLFKSGGMRWWFIKPIVLCSRKDLQFNISHTQYKSVATSMFADNIYNWPRYIALLVYCVRSCAVLKEDPAVCCATFTDILNESAWYCEHGGWPELVNACCTLDLGITKALTFWGGVGFSCYLLYKLMN
ncbi:hypothetical protein [Scale drop disease virus]|uniref:ORF_013L n=1 Tax=Scale drop disease virus TaxID=1697349 RepID=A0A0K1L6Q4_9VIRU|nr:ORF_013L [Scale drop disease virus]AKU37428.1 ORF_013L [Scale drop disease virus]QLI60684.1 hypothetical protein [Scale drop disease virus]QXJ13602.1 ORF013L [Scale drop disease virus]